MIEHPKATPRDAVSSQIDPSHGAPQDPEPTGPAWTDASPSAAKPASVGPQRRVWSTAAGAILGVEGAGLLALGVRYLVGAITGSARDANGALVTLALLVLGGVALLVLARAAWKAQDWSLAPALLAQALIVTVAWPLSTSSWWPVGVPLLLAALGGAACLVMARREAPSR